MFLSGLEHIKERFGGKGGTVAQLKPEKNVSKSNVIPLLSSNSVSVFLDCSLPS